ncbi:TetR/AcrR family transcriptional regulator [Qaidamihabitans albus]|uniref:TetR/AcrR family transcriptional regulator n=1 Tax=Qaidamihabitans albus TaxID=2795733 RepID=UPI0018F20196|nr:TetR/AcrR family transcriptional regulator [Qaidamihabitans albus]
MEKSTRDRIIDAATTLLAEGGRDAVSTRAVSVAAGVQAPAIYRIFGDKQGLLDAVASHGFETYLGDKKANPATDDPVADLRRGWDLHVGFGLANPVLYTLIYGDQRPGREPPAARQAAEILAAMIHRIAEAGRLRVTEQRAAHLVHATGRGTTLTLISLPEDRRDPSLSTMARESIIATITTDASPGAAPGPVSTAVAMRAVLPQATALTAAERSLLAEWLDRIATDG